MSLLEHTWTESICAVSKCASFMTQQNCCCGLYYSLFLWFLMNTTDTALWLCTAFLNDSNTFSWSTSSGNKGCLYVAADYHRYTVCCWHISKQSISQETLNKVCTQKILIYRPSQVLQLQQERPDNAANIKQKQHLTRMHPPWICCLLIQESLLKLQVGRWRSVGVAAASSASTTVDGCSPSAGCSHAHRSSSVRLGSSWLQRPPTEGDWTATSAASLQVQLLKYCTWVQFWGTVYSLI